MTEPSSKEINEACGVLIDALEKPIRRTNYRLPHFYAVVQRGRSIPIWLWLDLLRRCVLGQRRLRVISLID